MMTEILTEFIERNKSNAWFSHAGEAHNEYFVINDATEAFDNPKFNMFELWNSNTHALEKQAHTIIEDSDIDKIFNKVAEELEARVQIGIQSYFDRREIKTENMGMNADLGLWPEILQAVVRDFAWAAVETVIEKPGFFSNLTTIYAAGRWPCGWHGVYPSGQLVVL